MYFRRLAQQHCSHQMATTLSFNPFSAFVLGVARLHASSILYNFHFPNAFCCPPNILLVFFYCDLSTDCLRVLMVRSLVLEVLLLLYFVHTYIIMRESRKMASETTAHVYVHTKRRSLHMLLYTKYLAWTETTSTKNYFFCRKMMMKSFKNAKYFYVASKYSLQIIKFLFIQKIENSIFICYRNSIFKTCEILT